MEIQGPGQPSEKQPVRKTDKGHDLGEIEAKTDEEGRSALGESLTQEDYLTADSLKDREITVEKKPAEDSAESTPLHKACEEGDLFAVKQLIEDGASVNAKDENGRTPLHLAAMKRGNGEILRFLLEAKADVNVQDKKGRTALHFAAENYYMFGGKLLIDYGANLELVDRNGVTPLESAISLDYLDESSLLAGFGSVKIDPLSRDWHLNQAILFEHAVEGEGRVSDEAKKMLSFLVMNAFVKGAALHDSEKLQYTPVTDQERMYYRNYDNKILRVTLDALKMEKDFTPCTWGETYLVSGPQFKHAFVREFSDEGMCFDISSEEDLDRLVDWVKNDDTIRRFENRVVDFTQFPEGKDINEKKEIFENLLAEKLKESERDKLVPIAFEEFHEAHLFYVNMSDVRLKTRDQLKSLIRSSGYVPSPEELAHLQFTAANRDVEDVLDSMLIPLAVLATKGAKTPEVCSDFTKFLEQPTFEKFRNLSKGDNIPPYLKVYPEATCRLLEGLKEHPVDQAFKDEGLRDLLQMSYFRMLNSMANAQFKRKDQEAFINEIELIHQELKNILGVLSLKHGYGGEDFAKHAAAKLTSGDNPVIPQELGEPEIVLKASGMRCLSSILTAVEEQKGSNDLNVAYLDDTYYEEVGALRNVECYGRYKYDGDQFVDVKPDALDLYVCEFHHNISTERREYHTEDIASQVLKMYDEGLFAENFTVAIDTTIDLERSDEMRVFLKNEKIQKLINEGELNVVFFRSAQKFDMLGMDNYYGGVTTTLNKKERFQKFNTFMNREDDRQKGLSYQGLTHLQACGGDSMDQMRLLLMENTKRLYDGLPKGIIAEEGEVKPVEIAEMNDYRSVFLDIKTGGNEKIMFALCNKIIEFARDQEITLLCKGSFGFPMSNLVIIGNTKMRINPGLEDPETIDKLAGFFTILRFTLAEVMVTNPDAKPHELESQILNAIEKMEF